MGQEEIVLDLYEHGLMKYGADDVLASAVSCDWTGIAAELRHHQAAELPPFDLTQTEIGVATRCHPNAIVSRCGNGEAQSTRVTRGTIWTCPSGVREERIRLQEWHECLHIYLPSSRFLELSEVRGGEAVSAHQIRYLSDVPDALIREIAFTIVDQLRHPSSAGRVLVESLGISLAARLVHTCATATSGQNQALRVGHALDDARLRRVIDFIEQNIEQDLTINDLAAVACLSPFHFIRLFKNRTGVPPNRYLSNRRRERAIEMLISGNLAIAEIATRCCFSSRASFMRAFTRATGVAPARFRRMS